MLKMTLTDRLPHDESEQFKYHVLLDHLKLDTACPLALAHAHHQRPYTRAMLALQQRYGQPQQHVLREITAIQNLPSVHPGDSRSFSNFAIRVRALVGMLQSLENGEGDAELACASHVQQLLGKLPTEHVANYSRFSQVFLVTWLTSLTGLKKKQSVKLWPHRPLIGEGTWMNENL